MIAIENNDQYFGRCVILERVVLSIHAEKMKTGRVCADLQDRRNVTWGAGTFLSAHYGVQEKCETQDGNGKQTVSTSSRPER